jgi:hypothetical protein
MPAGRSALLGDPWRRPAKPSRSRPEAATLDQRSRRRGTEWGAARKPLSQGRASFTSPGGRGRPEGPGEGLGNFPDEAAAWSGRRQEASTLPVSGTTPHPSGLRPLGRCAPCDAKAGSPLPPGRGEGRPPSPLPLVGESWRGGVSLSPLLKCRSLPRQPPSLTLPHKGGGEKESLAPGPAEGGSPLPPGRAEGRVAWGSGLSPPLAGGPKALLRFRGGVAGTRSSGGADAARRRQRAPRAARDPSPNPLRGFGPPARGGFKRRPSRQEAAPSGHAAPLTLSSSLSVASLPATPRPEALSLQGEGEERGRRRGVACRRR